MKILLLLSQLLILCGYINGSKILILTPLGSKSHLNGFMGMTKSLADKGHELTIVSAVGSSKKTPNIRHVVIPSQYGASSLLRDVFTEGTSGPILKMMLNSPATCTETLGLDVIQNLKKEKFDVIMMAVFMGDCYLSLVHHFQAPLIYLCPAAVVSFINEAVGNPYFISLSGNVLMEGTFPFGYIYRLKATVLDLAFNGFLRYYSFSKMESLCREAGHCPPNMPSFTNIRANASLVIANSVKLLQPYRSPDMPNIIYAGGSHCNPSKPLPEELEKWIQGAGEEGFIFFSLGSVITPSDMPDSARKIIVKAFGKLKQRILWKWDKEMDDLPPNVRLGKWLPQQDILGHPKLKLFISHGGLHSILETTFHGARILGMPVFADQYTNIQEGVIDGWAESLYWDDLTEENLLKKIRSAISNKEMEKIVKHRAILMNDQPMSPKDNVVYWVEYVIRHNGAEHMRSPVHHMPFYILYNADVWLTIVGICVSSLAIFCYTIRAIFRCFCRKPKTAGKKKKKQQ